MKKLLQIFQKIGSVFLAFISMLALVQPTPANAAVNPKGQVSFVFDGGLESTYTSSLPVLEEYHIRGTAYIPAGCIEGIGSCRQNVNPNAKYMTWSQINELKNTYGWEIGSQGLDYVSFTTITSEQREYQLAQSNNLFEQKTGSRPKAFASPYGDVNYDTIAQIAKYHTTNRLQSNQESNVWPYDDFNISVVTVTDSSDIQAVYRMINDALEKKQWLVLRFTEISWPKLTAVAQYYKVKTQSLNTASQISHVVTTDPIVAGNNLLNFAWFNESGGEFWLADDLDNITEDTGSNGVTPYSQNAIKFTGNGTYSSLYTHQIPTTGETYYFKAYIDTRKMQDGAGLGFLIDEYDANGNWISWQLLGEVNIPVASQIYAPYQRTSDAVKSFSIGTIFVGDPNSTAYVDNYQVFNPYSNQSFQYPPAYANIPEQRSELPTPTPTATPTPTPQPTATPTPKPLPSFKAEFFANQNLSGTPVKVRQDETVDFDWGEGAPDAAVPANQFSARWTKSEVFDPGIFEFEVTADDGFRLYIDNSLVLDKWVDQPPTTYKIQKQLTNDTHTVKLEYYEAWGGATAKLNYKKIAPYVSTPEYSAKFWNMTDTGQTPAIPNRAADKQRIDTGIDYNWANGTPQTGINPDLFVAQWTQSIVLDPGLYRFTTVSDDGIRVSVNGQYVIDQWNDHGATTHTGEINLTGGFNDVNHIKVEYYEKWGDAVAKMSYVKIAEPNQQPHDGYTAKFWNIPNGTAEPIVPLTTPDVSRSDAAIDNDWKGQSPAAGINTDFFVVQWSKTAAFEAGTYTFETTSDDGIRVFVDNERIIDHWNDHAATMRKVERYMMTGNHTIRVEYYEKWGDAVAKFSYTKNQTTPPAGSANDLIVYDDQLQYIWDNWSWDSVAGFAATLNPFNNSSKHIKWTATNKYAGLYLHTGLGVNTSQYKELSFAIKATKANQKVEILLIDENNADIGQPRKLADFGGDPGTADYKVYTIPLADLGAADKQVKGIIIKDITGDTSNELYIDAIKFIAK